MSVGGKIILDESVLADMLDPDEIEGIELVKSIAFDSEMERHAYLLRRFGSMSR